MASNLTEKLANAWAKKLGTSIKKSLGWGNNGEAFVTQCDRVIKITQDKSEFVNSHYLIGNQHPNIVQIYQTAIFSDEHMGVFQELLETEIPKKIWSDMEDRLEAKGLDFWLMCDQFANGGDDEVDKEFQLTEDEACILDSVIEANRCLHRKGLEATDFCSVNVGFRNGDTLNYVMFDLANEETFEEDLDREILIIKMKLNKKIEQDSSIGLHA